jgi:hypothetical protein
MGLVVAAFGAQIAGWHHWISIGIAYGVGIALVVVAAVLITRSHHSSDSNSTENRDLKKENERLSILCEAECIKSAKLTEREKSLEEQIERLETTHAAELYRAEQVRSSAQNELRVLKGKIALLSPLQAQAVGLLRGLVEFRDKTGPLPSMPLDSSESPVKIGERLIDNLQAIHGWQSSLDARFRLYHEKDLEAFRLRVAAATPIRGQQLSADLWTLEAIPAKKIETTEEFNSLIDALWRIIPYLDGMDRESPISNAQF